MCDFVANFDQILPDFTLFIIQLRWICSHRYEFFFFLPILDIKGYFFVSFSLSFKRMIPKWLPMKVQQICLCFSGIMTFKSYSLVLGSMIVSTVLILYLTSIICHSAFNNYNIFIKPSMLNINFVIGLFIVYCCCCCCYCSPTEKNKTFLSI